MLVSLIEFATQVTDLISLFRLTPVDLQINI